MVPANGEFSEIGLGQAGVRMSELESQKMPKDLWLGQRSLELGESWVHFDLFC